MRKYYKIIYILLIISTSGCSGCEDCERDGTLVESFLLSDYEKSLIPYNDFIDLVYINEDEKLLKATTQPRTIKIEKFDLSYNSCNYWELESLENFIGFDSSGFVIQLEMGTFEGRTSFEMELFDSDDINNGKDEYFELMGNLSKDLVVDVSIKGFDFENVYVFNNNGVNENSSVEQILYSSEGNGIEFISFKDGRFLKRVEQTTSD